MCSPMARRLAPFAAALLCLAAGAGCTTKVAEGRADGAAIFSEVCARCHGPEGIPDAASVARLGVKPLVSPHVQRQLTDADIRNQILHGSRNKQMPSFAGALSEEQIEAIVRHVRTLRAR
jgi:mono/diheme cytochrome c family protein